MYSLLVVVGGEGGLGLLLGSFFFLYCGFEFFPIIE